MARCYICSGQGQIQVDSWKGRKAIKLESTCPRCRGTGKVTDGYTVDKVLADQPSPAAHDPSGRCICNYATDGPEGNPRCPSR